MHLLTLLVWTPVLGAALLLLLPQEPRLVRGVALVHAALGVLVAALVAMAWDPARGGVQLADTLLPWIPGEHPPVGVDSLSVAMVGLTTALFAAALLASSRIVVRIRAYYVWMLLLEALVLGVFVARSWVLFYACWELTLVPLFFLVGIWGGDRREGAALTMLIYTLGGSVFMLLATLALSSWTPQHGFAMDHLEAGARALPLASQGVVLAAFLVGLGVKVPMVPLHGWLPAAYVEAPTPVTIVLSAVLSKMGAYGLLRVSAMTPDAMTVAAPLLLVVGTLGVLHGALVAWRQHDLKAIVAWSSLAHMSLLIVALSTHSALGVAAATHQMVAHALVAGCGFLVVGGLAEAAGTRDARAFGGLGRKDPRAAALFALAFIASLAVPGTLGFVAEVGTLAAVVHRFGGLPAVLVAVGTLIWSAVAIRTVVRVVGGPLGQGSLRMAPLDSSVGLGGGLLLAAVLLLGLLPGWIGAPAAPDATVARASQAAGVRP